MSSKAFDLRPDDYDVIFNLANVLRQAGNNEEAEGFYLKAALLRPEVGDITPWVITAINI